MKKKYLFLLALPLAHALSAQNPKDDPPKTQLEAFAAETGAVIIKGYTDIGKVSGLGSIEVDCREITNAQSGNQTFGMVVKVTQSGRIERENSSFIDFDEIASLITGLDYIAKIEPDVTTLDNFEATYTTRGDFSITVFNNSQGKLSVAVGSGRVGKARAYLNLQQLAQLRSLIVDAKEKIESIK